MQGVQVQSLVKELRSHMLRSMAEEGKKKCVCVCVCVYIWITLLYSNDQHNIENQLHFNKK